MNNLLSYCGLTDARLRASEKDLPISPSPISGFCQYCQYSKDNKKSIICIYLDTQSGAASGSIFFRNTDSDPTIISGSEPLILWDHLYLTSSVNVVYNRTFKFFRLTILDWN